MIARVAAGLACLAVLGAVWLASGGDSRLTPDECAILYAAALEARDDAAVYDMQARGCDLSPARQSTPDVGGSVR